MRSAWKIDDDDFRDLESRGEQLQFLLRYAILAPSSHNTQPWAFRITDDGVEFFADFSRRLLIADGKDRELLMSVGAAMMNFRVAAARFGFCTTVKHETRSAEVLPIATIEVRETCAPDASLAALFPAIRQRHTNRAPFDAQPLDPEALRPLCDVLDAHPETLRLILARDRDRVADLVEDADRAQMARPAFRAELAEWVRRDATGTDGLSGDALGVPRVLSSAAPWLVRNVDSGGWRARRDRQLVARSSLLMLVTASDDRASLVRAGEVLERLLLTITGAGLQYSFLNQPIEVEELREHMRKLAGADRPAQLLLRIGSARVAAEATPRRPVASVLMK